MSLTTLTLIKISLKKILDIILFQTMAFKVEKNCQKLSSDIRSAKFHGIDMMKDKTDVNLESALSFQKSYVGSIIKAYKARFQDNDLISSFKVLNPSNMPSRKVGLAS